MATSRHIDYILNRERGQFNASIATSLALESLLNKHPDTTHNFDPLTKFDFLWINIRTLFRNLYTSMERLKAEALTVDDFVYGLKEDMQSIIDANLKPVMFYYCEYKNIDAVFRQARIRYPTTAIQMQYNKAQDATIEKLFKDNILIEHTRKEQGNCYKFKLLVESKDYTNVGIMTHFPIDLVHSYTFKKLYLIESHIGHIKGPDEWYTKYYKGSSMSIKLPFRLDFLQVFGDTNMFSPMKKNIRDEIIKLAERFKWTPMTTDNRIRSSYIYIQDNSIKTLLTSLRNS